MNDRILTIGDFRRMTKNLDDDFKLDVRIMEKVPEEILIKSGYPYPWNMIEGHVEFHDIGWSDKEFCIGVYRKGEDD